MSHSIHGCSGMHKTLVMIIQLKNKNVKMFTVKSIPLCGKIRNMKWKTRGIMTMKYYIN